MSPLDTYIQESLAALKKAQDRVNLGEKTKSAVDAMLSRFPDGGSILSRLQAEAIACREYGLFVATTTETSSNWPRFDGATTCLIGGTPMTKTFEEFSKHFGHRRTVMRTWLAKNPDKEPQDWVDFKENEIKASAVWRQSPAGLAWAASRLQGDTVQ